MTERQAIRFLRRGDGASAILAELGQRPLQTLLGGIMPAIAPGSPTTSNLTARMPLFELIKEGRRPIRDVTSRFVMGLYQPQVSDYNDKQKREEGAKAPGENFTEQEIEELKRAEAEAFKRIAEMRKKADLERIQNQRDLALIM